MGKILMKAQGAICISLAICGLFGRVLEMGLQIPICVLGAILTWGICSVTMDWE